MSTYREWNEIENPMFCLAVGTAARDFPATAVDAMGASPNPSD